MKSILVSIAILLTAGLAVHAQTDGFTVLTTESARRASLLRQPIKLPDATLVSADDQSQNLKDLLTNDGRVAIINFMFTRCISVCVDMGNEFQQLQQEIRHRHLDDQIRLISISFDSRDTPQWLANYRDRMKADPAIWETVMASHDDERQALLSAFGIIVVPAPMGQFEHNTAYHVVNPDATLTRIVDIHNTHNVLHYAQRQAALSTGKNL